MSSIFHIVMLSLFLATAAEAKQAAYKVTSQEGELLAWSGLQAGWRPVKIGKIYEENTIFQSSGASSVVLKETAKTAVGSPKTIIINSKNRVIFRLSGTTMRKVTLSNSFVKNVDTGVLDREKDNQDEPLDIMSAWRKIATLGKVTANDKGADNTNIGSKEERTKTALNAPVERIDFVYPSKGGILVPDQMPLVVPVIWKHAGEANGCYEIFLKSSTSSEFKRIGIAERDRYDMEIAEPGSYMVRIQCASGRAKSEELTFSILPTNAAEWRSAPKAPKKSN